jgi:capsular exopolysaccharide synthesis family protein
MIYSPLSMFAESVRKLRLVTDRASRQSAEANHGRGRVILITSAASGEGKTTVALSLARAYAQAGETTLLIDCDLRRPTVHRQLGWDPSTGLLDYLTTIGRPDAPSLRSLVRIEEASGIGVLVGSRRSDIATDVLVGGSRLEKVIAAAASTFDVVILDSPPLEPVVDSAYLARFAQSIVFVVRWARTTQPEIRRAMESLSGVTPIPPETTFVLNLADRATERRHASYSYYYNAG